MNFIDILIAIPLIYAAWKGFKKGLVIEVFTLLALLVGIYAGIHFSDWTSELIEDKLNIDGIYLPVVAFTLTFLAVGAMVYFAGKAVESLLRIAQLSMANKMLGLLLGLIKMIYVISVVIILVESYDQRGKFIENEIKEESLLYYPIEKLATVTIPALKESRIWLEDNIVNLMERDPGFTLQDVKDLKHTADSLGITLDDVIELKNLADSLGY